MKSVPRTVEQLLLDDSLDPLSELDCTIGLAAWLTGLAGICGATSNVIGVRGRP
jgi:hypothetical protein